MKADCQVFPLTSSLLLSCPIYNSLSLFSLCLNFFSLVSVSIPVRGDSTPPAWSGEADGEMCDIYGIEVSHGVSGGCRKVHVGVCHLPV